MATRASQDLGLTRLFTDRARTFSFAAGFLPPAQHEATVTLYAYFRAMDDLVDESPDDMTPTQRRVILTGWRSHFTNGSAAPQPELAALIEPVRERYDIPPWVFISFLDGMASDVGTVRMQSFAELYRYSFRVAGTVGLAMAHVLGASSPAGLWCAANLGVAMQLTNILRDIGADLQMNRVYLPADELAMFGLSVPQLFDLWERGESPGPLFGSLLDFQIARARAYYSRGLAGLRLLPPAARPTIYIAGRLYGAILNQVARDGAVVLHRRAATTKLQKLSGAARCLVALKLGRLPAGDDQAEEWDGTPELAWLGLRPDAERLLAPMRYAARVA